MIATSTVGDEIVLSAFREVLITVLVVVVFGAAVIIARALWDGGDR